MSQQVTVVLHFEQCRLVHKQEVYLTDVASVYAADPVWKRKIEELELYRFLETKKQKVAFSAMKVLQIIGTAYPEVSVTILGEPDFIVEYKQEKRNCLAKVFDWGKAVFVCFVMFFGSAFTIVTFNKDASVEEIFAMIYRLSEGAERNGPGELELAYSIGIPLGIILFFNHFLRKKIDSDPTPLQVQMRQYEKDVNATIIENVSREGKKEDV